MTLDEMTADMRIQVLISDKDETGSEIKDALYYTADEFKLKKLKDIDSEKAARVKAHKDKVKAMSEAPVKKSKDYSEEDLTEMAKLEGITVEELKERLDG